MNDAKTNYLLKKKEQEMRSLSIVKNEKINYYKRLHKKRSIFRDKRAVNDITIISVLVFIFFLTAIIIPFINSEFATGFVEPNTDGLAQEISDKSEEISGRITDISAIGVMITVLKLAFFDFGNSLGLPFWLDAMYTILGIILILVIARNIWVGGGG